MSESRIPRGRSSWIPEPHQQQLLQCALGKGSQALAEWERWMSRIGSVERADPSCQRLLPLVTWNLERQGWKGGMERDILYGTLKKTWFQNQLILHHIHRLAGGFSSRGIPLIFLKGAAMITGYYPLPRLRPMGDIDVLVPRHQLKAADRILRNLRWIPADRLVLPRENSVQRILFNACAYAHPEGLRCDLHWNLLKHYNFPGADGEVWHSPRKARVKGRQLLTLRPEDQLLHILEHALYWKQTRPVHWVADALMVLRSCPRLDRAYFFSRVGRVYLEPLVREMLRYLREYFPGDFPSGFRLPLRPSPPAGTELKLYRNLGYKNPGWWRRANRYRLRIRMVKKEYRFVSGFWMMLRFLILKIFGLRKQTSITL